MPVEMMTTVTPIARKPMTEICLTTLMRFPGAMNEFLGEIRVRRTHMPRKMKTIRYFRSTSARRARSSIASNRDGALPRASVLMSGRCCRRGGRSSRGRRCGFEDLLLRRVRSAQLGGDPAAGHDQDAVAHAQNLGHLRRHHDDRLPLA